MTKISINIEGSPEEVKEYLQHLLGIQPQEGGPNINWLPSEIEFLYESVTERTKEALKVIADNPNRQDVLENLGEDAHALMGVMSSVEFQRKRHFPQKPKPVEYDYEEGRYLMLPEVVQWIKSNVSD